MPRGPEIIATALRLAMEEHPGWVAVKLDFTNAFNQCSRRAFLRFLASRYPSLMLLLLALSRADDSRST